MKDVSQDWLPSCLPQLQEVILRGTRKSISHRSREVRKVVPAIVENFASFQEGYLWKKDRLTERTPNLIELFKQRPGDRPAESEADDDWPDKDSQKCGVCHQWINGRLGWNDGCIAKAARSIGSGSFTKMDIPGKVLQKMAKSSSEKGKDDPLSAFFPANPTDSWFFSACLTHLPGDFVKKMMSHSFSRSWFQFF